MAIVLENNFQTTLTASITTGSTTLAITSATGFPAIGSGVNVWITVQQGSNTEIMLATAIASLNVTVTRAQQNTTAKAFTAGAIVAIRATRDNFLLDSIIGGKAYTAVTPAADDKIIIQDTSDTDKPKTITPQQVRDLAPGTGTMTSAQLAAALTDESGTGLVSFADSGVWTPTLTCATPADLSVVYGSQSGSWASNGTWALIRMALVCTPTFTTASGEIRFTPLPFSSNSSWTGQVQSLGSWLTWPAGSTLIHPLTLASGTYFRLRAFGSGTADQAITMANITSGVQISITVNFLMRI